MEHRKYGVFGATEGGDVTLLHIGLRGQRLPQGQNGTFLGAMKHYGARRANVSVYKSDAERLWGLDLSVALQGMRGIVFLAHKRWAKTLREQSRVKRLL